MQRQIIDCQSGDMREHDVLINDPSLIYKCQNCPLSMTYNRVVINTMEKCVP